MKRRKLKWYRHVIRSSGLAKTILQGSVQGGRRRGRQRKRWEDNIKEWTGHEWNIILQKAENRKEWRKLVVKSTVVPQRSARLQDEDKKKKHVPHLNFIKECTPLWDNCKDGTVLCYLLLLGKKTVTTWPILLLATEKVSHVHLHSENRVKSVNTCLKKSSQPSYLPGIKYFGLPLSVTWSASRAEDPRFKSRLRWDFSEVESYQWFKNWHSSGYPARRLAL